MSVGEGDAYAARNYFYIYYFRRCKVLGYRDIPDAVGVCLGGVAFVIKGCDNLQNRGFAVGKSAKLPCREGHVIYAHLLHKPLAVRPVALLYAVGRGQNCVLAIFKFNAVFYVYSISHKVGIQYVD